MNLSIFSKYFLYIYIFFAVKMTIDLKNEIIILFYIFMAMLRIELGNTHD